jgi:hypothetical protein
MINKDNRSTPGNLSGVLKPIRFSKILTCKLKNELNKQRLHHYNLTFSYNPSSSDRSDRSDKFKIYISEFIVFRGYSILPNKSSGNF